MSKYLKIFVAVVAAVAMAAPAFADSKINGYFRNQFITDNVGVSGSTVNKAASTQIDQRLRIRYQNNLNEYVYFVYYGEVDTKWGQKSKGGIGGGGEAGADGVNVETKNVFLDFKIPNSIFSFRTGIQGLGDRNDYIFIADDWAALNANLVLTPDFDLSLIYSKAYENDPTQWDDTDLYIVQTNFKLMDKAKLMVDGYYLDDNSTNQDDKLYMVTGAVDAKLDVVGLKAWVAAQFGDDGTNDYTGLAASAKATMNAGPAKVGVRLTWFDKASGSDHPFVGGIGAYEFPGENLMIFYADKYYNNTSGGRHAMTDAVYAGNGLLALNATADMKLPANMYLNAGAGYFTATEDGPGGDKALGAELAARVGTKIAEKVDVSLGGAYALVGDYYKTGNDDPDNWYKVNFMFNVGF